jgi:hypothetical protein
MKHRGTENTEISLSVFSVPLCFNTCNNFRARAWAREGSYERALIKEALASDPADIITKGLF